MAHSANGKTVEAAGGVVWRLNAGGELEIVVVHRPRYGDWSLPKGKLEANERAKDAALREVLEETGFLCELGKKISEVRYRLPDGRPKRVRFWAMTVLDDVQSARDDEVDEVQWLRIGNLDAVLSYSEDLAVARKFAATV